MRAVLVVRRVAVLAVLGTLVVAVAAAPQARADDAIAISPARKKAPDAGRTRFNYVLDPGRSVTDRVWVENSGATKLKVTVSATDAYTAADGSFALLKTGEKATGVGRWVTFRGGKTRQTVELGPRESKTLPFTLKVPIDALAGDHAGGILATATVPGAKGAAAEQRIATRLYARVPGELQPALTISSFAGAHHGGLNPADGSVTTTATITNSGNVALSGILTLTATSWFGIGQSSTVTLAETLPGNTQTVEFELPGVPQTGFVRTNLVLVSGLSGDAPDPGPLPVARREAFSWAPPWSVLAVAAVVAVGCWIVLRCRRRREERLVRQWAAYAEEEARHTREELSRAGTEVGV